MMGPGFFTTALANDLFRVAAWGFVVGVVISTAIVVGLIMFVS